MTKNPRRTNVPAMLVVGMRSEKIISESGAALIPHSMLMRAH